MVCVRNFANEPTGRVGHRTGHVSLHVPSRAVNQDLAMDVRIRYHAALRSLLIGSLPIRAGEAKSQTAAMSESTIRIPQIGKAATR
jgi:hypothetical protein